MKSVACLAAAFAATALASPALAQEDRGSHLYVGVTGGSLGVGPEIGYRLSETVGVRANATFLGIDHGFNSDGMRYDGHVDLRSGGGMIDLYPFGGGFHVSGGLRINGNSGRARAMPTGNVRIGNATFTPAQVGVLTTETDIDDVAPVAGLGYSGGVGHGFVFGVEAGALFQGTIRLQRIQRSSTLNPPGVDVDAELERERLELQDDVNALKVYPIVQLRLGYRF